MGDLHTKIPGASHTYSKGDDQFPATAPRTIVRGKGYLLWDDAGREFVDWTMGLASVSVGHANDEVNAAVAAWLERGTNFARPSPLEEELADAVRALSPYAEMVKFGKHGSDGTSAAVRLARAYTGRDHVVACSSNPFYSVHDWWIGTTAANAGVPPAVRALTHTFAYGDLEGYESLMSEIGDEVACVIIEPASTVAPDQQCTCAHCVRRAPLGDDCTQAAFWRGVAATARKHGALFVLDENKTGFRMDLPGAERFYGLDPDMACYGKAIANGFSVSALAGRADVLDQGGILQTTHDRVFLLSATHGGETHALAAALKTIEILEREAGPAHMWEIGSQVVRGFNDAARAAGAQALFRMAGYPCFPSLIVGPDVAEPQVMRTLLLQEMARRGVLFNFVVPALAHDAQAVGKTNAVALEALKICVEAAERGDAATRLEGPPLRPVFRTRN